MDSFSITVVLFLLFNVDSSCFYWTQEFICLRSRKTGFLRFLPRSLKLRKYDTKQHQHARSCSHLWCVWTRCLGCHSSWWFWSPWWPRRGTSGFLNGWELATATWRTSRPETTTHRVRKERTTGQLTISNITNKTQILWCSYRFESQMYLNHCHCLHFQ